MHSGCEHQKSCFGVCTAIYTIYGFCSFNEDAVVLMLCVGIHIRVSQPGWSLFLGVGGVWGVFVGVVVSVLGRSVDALVPGADEGRGRPR